VEKNGIKPGKQVDLPRGLYLPLWTFDVGGAIDYTGETITVEEESFGSRQQPRLTRVSDRFPVMVDDLPIPASRKPSSVFIRLISTFDLHSVKPYDPRFLADWPAEVYDIPLADASLDARSRAYARYKHDLPALAGSLRIVHTSSANLSIESFKLILLPVWMTELPFKGRERLVLINGQTGAVEGDLTGSPDRPKKSGASDGGLPGWLSDLLDDK
jgi:hypothetical protein